MSDENGDQLDAAPQEPDATVRFWLEQVGRYDREYEKYVERTDKIWKIYAEQQRQATTGSRAQRRVSMLWANISTMQPAVYARLAQPAVSRRFKDNDPVARLASELLERSLHVTFEDAYLDSTMRMVRDDFLLGARGTAWVRYEADIGPLLDEAGQPVMQPVLDEDGQPALDEEGAPLEEPAERVADERVAIDYVHWRDFGHTPARYWGEVTAVWRKVYLTKTELKNRFGEQIAAQVGLDHSRAENGQFISEGARKATVYEIWDKATGKVYFIAKACPVPLEVTEPYLSLKSFWPCPKPAYGTLQDGALIPVPDYVFYQDQAEEIDQLTARIGKLTEQLKVVGFYPKGDDSSGAAEIERALQPGVENKMFAIPGWSQFTEKGGVNAVQYLPVEQVLKVLQGCIQLRKELKQDLYEVTGISDIIRGSTDPNETKGAQQLKAQWGSIRIRDRQMVLAHFIRDLSRIAGEIIADKFQPETLMAMANMPLPSEAEVQAQMMAQAQAAAMQQTIAAARPQPVPMMPGMGGPAPMMAPPGPAPMPPQAPPPGVM